MLGALDFFPTVVSLNPSTTEFSHDVWLAKMSIYNAVSSICSIAVFPDGTVNLEVLGVLGFALDTCAVHLPQAGDLVL